MKWFVVGSVLLLPTLLFGAEDTPKDIVPRALNFLLFVAILYYFIATPLRNFFKARAEGIASELDKVQAKLKESKTALETAQKSVQTAQQEAENIIETAKREALILKQKIAESAEKDMELLLKQYDDFMEFERRRAEQTAIAEILDELFASEAMRLDKAAYMDILLKKVA